MDLLVFLNVSSEGTPRLTGHDCTLPLWCFKSAWMGMACPKSGNHDDHILVILYFVVVPETLKIY